MSSVPDPAAPPSADDDLARLDDVWTVFALTWSAAVLFHLAGNPTLAPPWGRALLGVTAVALLMRPRVAWLAVPLSLAVVTNVWLEAPLLGNHWLLHGLIALIVLGAVLTTGGRPAEAMARVGGPARLTLLAFYGFAAFAKINADFFDPAVSCATFYLRESADSWGASGLVYDWPGWADRAVVFVVAGIELAIPVLLVVRRTRNAGVLVALVFHYVLAVDRVHQFFDFSSILVALFLLFLTPATLGRWVDRAREIRGRVANRWESGPELLGLFVGGAVLMAVVLASGPRDWNAPMRLRDIGVWVWIAYGFAGIVSVAWSLRQQPGRRRSLVGPGVPAWLLIIPVLAVANGLTPYLEVKNGYGWNMYSNLAVVDGDSNHLVVRRGLPLTDANADLVQIVESDDAALDFYIEGDWLLPERQLLDHLAGRSEDIRVAALRNGEPVTYRGGGGARPAWQQKVQVFRAVDASGPTNCQPSFGPAR